MVGTKNIVWLDNEERMFEEWLRDEKKESLFRCLQMGNLVQAKSDLKKLRKEVKRF